jgi:hypothetical protein
MTQFNSLAVYVTTRNYTLPGYKDGDSSVVRKIVYPRRDVRTEARTRFVSMAFRHLPRKH